MLGNFERLFVFGLVSYVCVIGSLCNERSESVLCGRFIIFIGADVNSVFQFIWAVLGYECVDYLIAVAVVFGSLFIFCGAYSEEMPAVAEHAVIHPVGSCGAYGYH